MAKKRQAQLTPPPPAPTKHWFDNIVESPTLAGVLAMIAFAVSFSPKASALAMWVCLAVACLLSIRMVYTLDHVRKKSNHQRRIITGGAGLVSCLFFAALGWWLVLPLKGSEQAPNPDAGFLQFEKIDILQQFSVIASGAQFGGNLYAVNPTTRRIFNAYGFSGSFVEVVDEDEKTDHRVRELFEQNVSSVRQRYMAGEIKGTELGAGQSIWTSVVTRPLTPSEADGIARGTVRIYFVSWLAWADAEGHKDSAYDCRWLQSATLPRPAYSQKDIIWHFCQ
jgi:hypothetical protein